MTTTYRPTPWVDDPDDARPQFAWADPHFWHRNILTHCPNRPWASVEEMNWGLIERFNAVVPENGRTFVVGDWAMSMNEDVLAIRALLNGEVVLVPGNHDPMFSGRSKGQMRAARIFEEAGFIVAPELIEVTLRGGGGERVPVRVCHFPTRPDAVEVDHTGRDRYAEHRPAPNGRWLIHGHVHQHGGIDRARRTINVGVDAPYTGFAPMSEQALVDIILDR